MGVGGRDAGAELWHPAAAAGCRWQKTGGSERQRAVASPPLALGAASVTMSPRGVAISLRALPMMPWWVKGICGLGVGCGA
jgi:hypothetical protein